MKNVEFISAGAGSGKTYTLETKIVDYVRAGGNADQIILTTFTKPAANELKERVRSRLYKEGYYQAASRIDNASIGTIHSIANDFILRYWYLLGVNANLVVMGDVESEVYTDQSMAMLPTVEDIEFFDALAECFNVVLTDENSGRTEINYDFWKGDLKSIISKITEHCISKEDLEKARKNSKRIVRDILAPQEDVSFDYQEVLNNLNAIIDVVATMPQRGNFDPKKKCEKLESIKSNLERGLESISKDISVPPVQLLRSTAKDVCKVFTKKINERCPVLCCYFAELEWQVMSDIKVYNALALYIDKIFDMAQKWVDLYAEFKVERSLISYNDMLEKFEQLLDFEQVRDDLSKRYKIALIDEFQDCSPLQVRTFSKLSYIVDRSYWVGDIKQAIYNFRGTNTELVKAIISKVREKNSDGNSLMTLDKCWRSNSTIVNAANTIFSRVFGQDMVTLGVPKDRKNPPAERDLTHWHFNVNKADDRYLAMAHQVRKLCADEGFAYKDVALLYHDGKDCVKMAEALRSMGIPCNLLLDKESNAGANSDEAFTLLQAIVAVVANDNNLLSKAIIARYTEPTYTSSKILSEKMLLLSEGADGQESSKWLDALPSIQHLMQLRSTIGNQSVSAAVETIMVELNVEDLIRRINPNVKAYKYCNKLIEKAVTYETLCLNMNLDCSMAGFANYLKEHPVVQMSDDDGVVVSTYHKSKGLEWQCVILNSLHNTVFDRKRGFYGVQVVSGMGDSGSYSTLTLIPRAIESVSLIDRIEKHPHYIALSTAAYEERKRIMYVGMTRPRELLITTTAKATRSKYDTTWIDTIVGEPMNAIERETEVFEWLGLTFRRHRLDYITMPEVDQLSDMGSFMALKQRSGQREYMLRDIQPSKAPLSPRLKAVSNLCNFAPRLNSHCKDDALLGDCIHQLMCIYNGQDSFVDTVKDVTRQYGVIVDAHKFVDSVVSFYQQLDKLYGSPAYIERELPFAFRRDSGEIVHGEIDMVYGTEQGDVIIDYKTYNGKVSDLTDEQNKHCAAKYSGQIAMYEEALLREGRQIRDRVVCYISLGELIRLEYE